jgi:hypothetical protein
VAASCIGNSRTIRLKGTWEEPAVVWSTLVADSGTLKSPALQKVVEHLFRIQKRLFQEFKEKQGEYQEALQDYKETKRQSDEEDAEPGEPPEKPRLRRVICSDTTIEKLAEILEDNPRGVLVVRDEQAGWFGSFTRYKSQSGCSDLPYWLEMHRAGHILIDRKTTERKNICVERAAVSVTGGIQPGALKRALTTEFLDAGGGARILMAMPPKRPKLWSEVEIAPEVEQAYHDIVEKLLALNLTTNGAGECVPHALRLSAGAKDAWSKFYNAWGKEQVAVEGELAAAYSKLEGYAARFALIHHVVSKVAGGEDELAPVGEESINVGVTLSRWFANEARRIYAVLSETDDERDTRRRVEFIRSRGGAITARDLQRSNGRKYRKVEDADKALESLAQAGLGEWVPPPPSPKGGRPARLFTLYPTPDTTDTTPGEGGRDDGDLPPQLSDTPPAPVRHNPQVSREKRGSVGSVGRRTEDADSVGEGGAGETAAGGSVGHDGVVSEGGEYEEGFI